MDLMEKAIAYAPPFMYSHVTGIKSPPVPKSKAG